MERVTAKMFQLAKAGDPSAGWVMEPKLDGHRMMATVLDDGTVRMYARTGVDKTGRLPEIEECLRWAHPGTLIDGEIVSLRKEGGDWGRVQEVMGSASRTADDLTFVAFDLLWCAGNDVRGLPLSERRKLLEILVGQLDCKTLTVAPQVPYTPEAVETLIEAGWEGAIVKNPNARYASGKRGHGWLKIKATETEDVVVIGAQPGKGKFEGLVGALIFGQYENGALVEKGKCSGMTDAQRESFTRRMDGRYAGTNMLGEVIEVQHMGKMPTGGWRHPQFKRIRTDKRPEECIA